MKKELLIGAVLLVLVAGALLVLFSGGSPVPTSAVAPASAGTAAKPGVPYKEITNPSGFVNTGGKPITIGEYIGKKVILLDVMTYSCINCQRTFPYAVAWYEKYKDDGLIIIGIHTPEFAFEKDINNVAEAMKKFGITFPVVLDNDYGTWNAYGNSYWPRKYLIDIHGNVVYDHIGEGAYDETEMKIRELLAERAKVLGDASTAVAGALAVDTMPEKDIDPGSPETYFGAARNEFLANGAAGTSGTQTLSLPAEFDLNRLYLKGQWNFLSEYAQTSGDAGIVYRYSGKNVYFVASSDTGADVAVYIDGKPIAANRGTDVNAQGVVYIKEARLYELIQSKTKESHVLELRIQKPGLKAFTFTFG